MKTSAAIILGCMMQFSVRAAEIDFPSAPPEAKTSVVGRYISYATSNDYLPAPARTGRLPIGAAQSGQTSVVPMRESPFARAIGRAAKKGVVELAVEGYTKVLIQCQKEQSVVLTSSFLRSDSQQAHCYRF